MTKEKILEKVLAIKPECGESYKNWMNLVGALKQDIRDENNKKAGNGNTAKLAKAIFRSADSNYHYKDKTQNKMLYAKTIDGLQYILDGHRVACFFTPLDIPEWEGPEGTWYNGVPKFLEGEWGEALTLPEMAELKAAIKIGKAQKQKTMWIFETSGGARIFINAHYLLDFMEGFGSIRLYPSFNNPSKAPLYIESEKGAGIILPINPRDYNCPCGAYYANC